MAKSSYFYEISTYTRIDKDEDIKQVITEIFNHHNGRYGYPRITLELKNLGYKINHKKVQRIMKVLNLKAKKCKGKYKSYKGEVGKTCNNSLLDKIVDEENNKTYYKRNFQTTQVNQKWSTDVSEFHISSGKLYLSPIIDMNNREIISYSISKSPNYNQITNMLNDAFSKHDNLEGLILHSDQGWQYQMYDYQIRLKEKGIIQSMSRKGNCLDNSPIENFFGIMKNEMFYGYEYTFNSLDELEVAMKNYIDYYNNERIIEKLKGLSPCSYRQQSLNQLILN